MDCVIYTLQLFILPPDGNYAWNNNVCFVIGFLFCFCFKSQNLTLRNMRELQIINPITFPKVESFSESLPLRGHPIHQTALRKKNVSSLETTCCQHQSLEILFLSRWQHSLQLPSDHLVLAPVQTKDIQIIPNAMTNTVIYLVNFTLLRYMSESNTI